MIKNTYLTSYFPFFSILLFSMAFALNFQLTLIKQFQQFGLYEGLLEFFSERSFNVSLWFLLVIISFMVFSALKLISDTMIELSLFFFSKDVEGKALTKIRGGVWIFLMGAFLSIFLMKSFYVLVLVFLVVNFIYFLYFLFKVSEFLSFWGIIGMVVMHFSFWLTFLFTIVYVLIKFYNALLSTLSI